MTDERWQEKRERIMEAAMAVFSKKGYHQAKIEDIAMQADVGKGTVYEYFSSKLELFQETFKKVISSYMDVVHSGTDDAAGNLRPADRLRRLFAVHLKVIFENRDFTVMTFGDIGGMDEELLRWMYEMRKEGLQRLAEIVQQGIECGDFRPVDPEITANLIVGLMKGAAGPVLIEGKDWDPQKLADATADILLTGICKQES